MRFRLIYLGLFFCCCSCNQCWKEADLKPDYLWKNYDGHNNVCGDVFHIPNKAKLLCDGMVIDNKQKTLFRMKRIYRRWYPDDMFLVIESPDGRETTYIAK